MYSNWRLGDEFVVDQLTKFDSDNNPGFSVPPLTKIRVLDWFPNYGSVVETTTPSGDTWQMRVDNDMKATVGSERMSLDKFKYMYAIYPRGYGASAGEPSSEAQNNV